MEYKSLDEIRERAQKRETRRIAVAAAEDLPVLKAVMKARELDIAIPVLVGDTLRIKELALEIGFDLSQVNIIDEKDPARSCVKAVELIREGGADILMKGMVATAPLLRAVLDKEKGLRKSDTLSHLAIFQTRHYHKLLGVTDAAMNIAPDLNEKAGIIRNAAAVFLSLGISEPKVAVICPLETVNEKIGSTLDAAVLTQMNRRGQINGCIVDGPLALDNAISEEAARHKGIQSRVAGHADILLAPDLNSGNILYKSISFLSDGVSAAIVTGAAVPIVLTSRADSEESKLYSIALAAAI
ncbi:MAG TPA: phosphate butyryltransferase [Bacteroidales bacterium]|nr:phosphate butyryltransferase [Bacteroidales bacterium]